jgi:hypothetical protein
MMLCIETETRLSKFPSGGNTPIQGVETITPVGWLTDWQSEDAPQLDTDWFSGFRNSNQSVGTFHIAADSLAGLLSGSVMRLRHVNTALILQTSWQGIRSRVSSWTKLTDGWEAEDSKAPSRVCLDAALQFVKRAEMAALPVGETYIDADGEIGFRWSANGDFGTVAFLPDCHLVAFCPGSGEPFEIDSPISDFRDWDGLFNAIRNFVVAGISLPIA